MGLRYSISWASHNPIVRFTGLLCYNDVLDANNSIIGDARFDAMEYQIFDHTEITDFIITEAEAEIMSVLDLHSTVWNKKVKVALVFKDDRFLEKIKKYCDLMEYSPWEVRTFYSLQEAIDWCNERDLE